MPIQTSYQPASPVNRFAYLLLAVEQASKSEPLNNIDFDRLPDVFVCSQNVQAGDQGESARISKTDLNQRPLRKKADKQQNHSVEQTNSKRLANRRHQLAREQGFKNYYAKLNAQARRKGFENQLARRDYWAQLEGFKSYSDKRRHQVLVKHIKKNPFSGYEIS